MKIGILKETKNPPDRRVPLTPFQCRKLLNENEGLEIVVQPDRHRAFSDTEYKNENIPLDEDLSGCDILLGVKEVKISALQKDKTYLFFSHTAKKQPYNRELLRAVLEKKITLIDYEYLTDSENNRIIAFGKWAGIVGAYNGLLTYGKKYRKFELKPAWKCSGKDELFRELKKVKTGNIKILITGGGRVAGGAREILIAAGINEIDPSDFLNKENKRPFFSRIDPWHYVERTDGKEFELSHFFNYPEAYRSAFFPFTKKTNLYIPCHFWDPRSPVFMSKEDMKQPGFRINIIADISCDVNGPIPSTIRASSILDPVYGYDPQTGIESDPWKMENVTVMAVDNLPGELPRNASEDFGSILAVKVIPFLEKQELNEVIKGATIAKNGELTEKFNYLDNFVKGLE